MGQRAKLEATVVRKEQKGAKGLAREQQAANTLKGILML